MAKNINSRPAQQAAAKAASVRPAAPVGQTKKVADTHTGMSLVTKLCILLFAVGSLVYANSLYNDFVLDDIMVLTQNTMVRNGLSGIPELLTTPHLKGHISLPSDTYRPLSLVMFAIEFQFFGENAMVGHFFNIVLFGGCVVLLFLVLNRLFGGTRTVLALVASLLFAVHPIHTEVVANIKSRDEILCFFFAFLSIHVLINYMRHGKPVQLVLGLFYFYLSLISKETAITFLGVIPLVFFFYANENRKRAIIIAAGTVLSAAIFLGIRAVVLSQWNADGPYVVGFIDNQLAGAPGAASRFATELLILGLYLKLLVVPYPLICNYAFNSIPFVTFANVWVIGSIAVYLALGGISIYRLVKYKRDPWAFGILFYMITISLFSNIPFLVGAALGERFAFFASAGVCVLLALVFEKLVVKKENADVSILKSSLPAMVLIPVLAVYAIMTIDRNADWKDNFTLYMTDVKKTPDNTWVTYFMGAEYQKKFGEETDPAKQQQLNNESIKYLQRSLQIYRNNNASEAELGAAYYRAKMYDSAVFHLKRSLELNPRQANASSNLGTLYLTLGRYAEALPYYRQTVNVNPGHVLALFNLGVCHVQVQHLDSAVNCFKKVTELAPQYENYKSIQYTAIVYKMMGIMDSAKKYEAVARQYDAKFGI